MKESIPLKMEKADVEKLLKVENKGGQVMLEVDGQTYDALIKEVDYNPLKGYVDEIDFQALVSNEKFILLLRSILSTLINLLPVYHSRCYRRFLSRLFLLHW